ncbi:MAG TPA: C-GCAxxG-C-C family (seleno)protein [Bacillota bacterium]|nr:C-GCAxxG-C-C family (seleno)protein [Bacillota bacterium]
MNKLIKEYYLEKGYNCAESMLLLANKDFELNLNETHIKMMAGFGGGLCKEKVCGVVTGGIAVLSVMFSGSSILKDLTVEFQDKTLKEFSTNDCKDIKPLHREELNKCANVIDKAYKILKEIILNNKEKTN